MSSIQTDLPCRQVPCPDFIEVTAGSLVIQYARSCPDPGLIYTYDFPVSDDPIADNDYANPQTSTVIVTNKSFGYADIAPGLAVIHAGREQVELMRPDGSAITVATPDASAANAKEKQA